MLSLNTRQFNGTVGALWHVRMRNFIHYHLCYYCKTNFKRAAESEI